MAIILLPISKGKARCKGGNVEPLYGPWVSGGWAKFCVVTICVDFEGFWASLLSGSVGRLF
jgi:hypothetical protein